MITTAVFQDVLEKAGMNIYYYLQPKELFSFGMCCHKLWNDIIVSVSIIYYPCSLVFGQTI